MRTLIWGIYLVIFCLPLYLARLDIFGIPTTVLEILIYILFAFWLSKSFKWSEFKKLFLAHYLLFIAIILIIIGVSLATIFSSDLRISAGIWKGWFLDPLLFFIILVFTIKNVKQIKGALYSLFLSGTVVAIISLIYLLQGNLNPVGRLQAFYNSPNYLAMYLASAIVISFGYYLFTFLAPPSVRGSKTFILLSIVCLLLSIIFTQSYGALLGIIVAIYFGLLLYLYKLKKQKLVWAVLCLGLIMILALSCFALVQRADSFNARLVIWQKALAIFKTNPIIGIGPGTFGNYFPLYPEWGVPQPHNIFLAFLLQTGIIGFIGFILLLIWFFRPSASKSQAGKLRLLLMSIMAYILVHGLADTTYWKNDLSVIFWLVVGLMAVLQNKNFGE